MTHEAVTTATVELRTDEIKASLEQSASLVQVAKMPPRLKIKIAMLRRVLDGHARDGAEAFSALIEEHRKRDHEGKPVGVDMHDPATGVVVLKRDENGEPIRKRNEDGTPSSDAVGRPVFERLTDETKTAIADPVAFTKAMKEHNETRFKVDAPTFTFDELDALASLDGVTGEQVGGLLPFVATPVTTGDLLPTA